MTKFSDLPSTSDKAEANKAKLEIFDTLVGIFFFGNHLKLLQSFILYFENSATPYKDREAWNSFPDSVRSCQAPFEAGKKKFIIEQRHIHIFPAEDVPGE